jgi:hypothetical protein
VSLTFDDAHPEYSRILTISCQNANGRDTVANADVFVVVRST